MKKCSLVIGMLCCCFLGGMVSPLIFSVDSAIGAVQQPRKPRPTFDQLCRDFETQRALSTELFVFVTKLQEQFFDHVKQDVQSGLTQSEYNALLLGKVAALEGKVK